jgi:hypothetical protein
MNKHGGGPVITDITEEYWKQIMAAHPRHLIAAAADGGVVRSKAKTQLALPAPVSTQLALQSQASSARALAIPERGTVAVLRAPVLNLPDEIPDYSETGELMYDKHEQLALPAPDVREQLALMPPPPPTPRKRHRNESTGSAAAAAASVLAAPYFKKIRKETQAQKLRRSAAAKKRVIQGIRGNVPVHTHTGSHVHQPVSSSAIPDFDENGQLVGGTAPVPRRRNTKRKRGEGDGAVGKASKKLKTKGAYFTTGKGRHSVKRKAPVKPDAPRKRFKASTGKSGGRKRKHIPTVLELEEEERGKKIAKNRAKLLEMGVNYMREHGKR